MRTIACFVACHWHSRAKLGGERLKAALLRAVLLVASFLSPIGVTPALAEQLMANPQSSETPAHQRLVALIEAVNSGDDERLSKFVADTFDGAGQRPEFATQQVADLKRLSRLSGGLELRRVERSTSAAIEALLQTRGSRAWYKLSLFVTAQPPEYSEAAAPYNIVGMDWRNIAAPLSLAEKQSDAEVRHRLDRLMNWLVERDGFSGVVQVERGGQTLYARAFGLANRERNQANGLDTRFNLASITKMFSGPSL